MWRKILQWLSDEEAASIIEYSLLLFFIALVCVGIVAVIGRETNAKYESVWPGAL